MKTIKLEFHHDAGHGWLKVPKAIVDHLESFGHKVTSQFSYFDGLFYYLEEDSDATKFCKAFKEVNDSDIELSEIYDGNESFIRGMSHS